MSIGDKIKLLRKSLNLTQEDLAIATNTTKQTSHKYETGIISNIPASKIKAMADKLGTTPAYLMGWNDKPTSTKFDNLPSPDITEDYVEFPVIGEVAAGYESIAIENWEGDKVKIPIEYLTGHSRDDFFVLKVKGDSMIPLYHEGDKVLVLKQSTMNYSGQIGVAIYGDENATLKRIEYAQGEDWMKLVPLNLNHPIVKIENEELEHCRVLGIPRLLIREIND